MIEIVLKEDEINDEFDKLLKSKGMIAKIEAYGLKVLGNGNLTKQLTVKAAKFTQSAVDKISAAGGSVEVV